MVQLRKREKSTPVIILAAVLCLLGCCFLMARRNASLPVQTTDPASVLTPAPFTNAPSGDGAGTNDMGKYHLEVWYSGGRLPVITAYQIPLETIAEENYIPTVIIEDRNKEPYLVNYEANYFSRITVNTYFYEPGEDGFHQYEDEQGNSVEKLEELKPGDYLMNIRVWAMVYDVVYAYDCYMHIIIPGTEKALPWPVTTPTPPPVSEPVPSRFINPDGDWITPVPALRTDQGLFQTPKPTPTQMLP